MAFWTDATIQPKRNYRFRVNIVGFGSESVVWWAKGFKPPSYEISEATHDHLDNKFFFPGRTTWSDCSMTLVDPATPDAVFLTNQILVNSGYKVKSLPGELDTVSKAGANAAIANSTGTGTPGMGGVSIEILDAAGAPIETWTLMNAWIKGVSFSDLAYDNDDLRTIDITFKYDWATCDTSGGTQFGITGS